MSKVLTRLAAQGNHQLLLRGQVIKHPGRSTTGPRVRELSGLASYVCYVCPRRTPRITPIPSPPTAGLEPVDQIA